MPINIFVGNVTIVEEENLKNKVFAEKTEKQVQWWAYAAWTLPFVALSGLFFVEFLGFNYFYEKLLVIGAVIFFAISVFWWWWAIFKIARVSQIIISTSKKFEEVLDQLKSFKNDTHK